MYSAVPCAVCAVQGCGIWIVDALSHCLCVDQVHRNNRNGYDGFRADYWSMGVILYIMLVAAPPISGNEKSADLARMSELKSLNWYDRAFSLPVSLMMMIEVL